MFDSLTKEHLGKIRTYTTVIFGEANFKWHYCEYNGKSLPDQGWKIHISANLSNAEEILNIVLSYIITHRMTFKHAGSISDLAFLNSGKGGITQVGKFITIYCLNDAHFKTSLRGLSRQFTKFFKVPFIITDKRPYPHLPLFYRYGAFRKKEVQNTMGIFESVITDSYGKPVPDKRANTFSLPSGVPDPFKNKGQCNTELNNKLLLNKYVTFKKLSDTYKTETYFGIDLSRKNSCIIKIAKADIEIERDVYPHDLLINEIKILKFLNHQYFPQVIDDFEYSNRKVMVTSLIDGINLFDFISLNAVQGIFLSRRQLKKLFLSLLNNIQVLEEKGITHNDLKPGNIIVDRHLNTSIIDFETSSFKSNSPGSNPNLKSRGYYNRRSKPSNPDYYALGMILYFIQTGYNISDAPREDNIMERPLHYLTGKSSIGLEKCISKLCNNNYNTIATVIRDFNQAINAKITPFRIKRSEINAIADSYHAIPQNIVEWLFKHSLYNNQVTYWNSTHRYNSGEGRTDINIGSSGILLFLAYFFITTKQSPGKNLHLYENAVQYINTTKNQHQITGLFVGEAGKALATITALFAIGKFNVNVIQEKLKYIKYNLPLNNDFYNGKAGAGFLFAILYAVTQDRRHIETAMKIAKEVIKNRSLDKTGIFWEDNQTQKHFIGFAHGIAGIGYFLITLYRLSRDKQLLKTIYHIADTLLKNAVTYSKRSKLINWPAEPGTDITNNHWCNGTSGIGIFFLELYKITRDNFFLDILHKCAYTVIKASAYMNPTMCHGLSGNINFLISYYQLTKDVRLKAEIFRLAEVLKMSGIVSDDHFLFPSESPYIITPDLWVGFTGTAYVFQRLTNIDDFPDFISLEYYQSILKGQYPTLPVN